MKQLTTPWTTDARCDHPLPEYPRPTLVREQWINLNGFWDYAITPYHSHPRKFDGKIRVPFSPEANLSEVNRQLKPGEALWYHKKVLLPEGFPQDPSNRLILHFGAADQFCTVYINQTCAGSHKGGYLPFSVDITEMLPTKNEFDLLVRIHDVSDASYHSRGKQTLNPGGMFYTAISGLWQTVWMEAVHIQHIRHLRITPDLDASALKIRVCTTHSSKMSPVSCEIFEPVFLEPEGVNEDCCQTRIRKSVLIPGKETAVPIPQPKAWTPQTPWLYPIKLTYCSDVVYTYAALRKCHIQKDSQGIPRLFLNHQPYFQTGVLDQGYWPDGLYTAPTDEAMIYDIRTMKDLGFNMLRKHAKIEPDRWYFHCDRMGMLVWQDLVNGGSSYQHWFVTYLATLLQYLHLNVSDMHCQLLSRENLAGRREFCKELKETLRTLYNHPCIICWVPFNEGWGQFSTRKITQRLHILDKTRLVDSASGWFDQKCGDIKSLHFYFFTLRVPKDRRVSVISEFGGYSLRIPAHSSCQETYGYRTFSSKKDLDRGFESLMNNTIYPSVKKGISAVIYTQLSDIEQEVNGILTYDRKIMKIHPLILQKWNARLKRSLSSDHEKVFHNL